MGQGPEDVVIVGDRIKRDVIRADRADGIIIKNLTAEQASFNGIDVVETNGFRLERRSAATTRTTGCSPSPPTTACTTGSRGTATATRASTRAPGPRATASATASRSRTRARTTTCSASRAPPATAPACTTPSGSTTARASSTTRSPPATPACRRTARSGRTTTSTRTTRTSSRRTTRSTAPRTSSRTGRATACAPSSSRPSAPASCFYGANGNIIKNNRIWDNWRWGYGLFWVPAAIRGDNDPANQRDTSNENRITNNWFGDGDRGRAGAQRRRHRSGTSRATGTAARATRGVGGNAGS